MLVDLLLMWKITYPIAKYNGKPGPQEEILTDESPTPKNEWFQRINDYYILSAPSQGGVTTPNSKYARCEFRELDGDGNRAAWNFSGKKYHTLSYRGSIVSIPDVKREVVFGQVHDKDDDVMELILQENKFVVRNGATQKQKTLIPDYKLGELITVEITCRKKVVSVQVIHQGKSVSYSFKTKMVKGCYFKVGCYQQGLEGSSSVIVYDDLKATHYKKTEKCNCCYCRSITIKDLEIV